MKAKPRCQFAEGEPEHCHRHSTCKWGDHWFCDEHGSRRKAEPAPPATFAAHGFTWFPHTPGDPMPCERNALVAVLCRDNDALHAAYAGYWHWDKAPHEENEEIIGWRYATPQAEPLPVEDELATLREIVTACMKAMPCGNIATHTPKNLAGRITELAQELAAESLEKDEMLAAIKEAHAALQAQQDFQDAEDMGRNGPPTEHLRHSALATLKPFLP